jgi:hypothetical protein
MSLGVGRMTDQKFPVSSLIMTISYGEIKRKMSNKLPIHGYEEEFEDTKGVIRIRTSKKNRQHNVVQSLEEVSQTFISNWFFLIENKTNAIK